MEAIRSSETSVTTYKTIWCYNPEYHNRHVGQMYTSEVAVGKTVTKFTFIFVKKNDHLLGSGQIQ
jgi:hypothetical protein